MFTRSNLNLLGSKNDSQPWEAVAGVAAVAATGRFIHFGGDTREQTHIIDGDSFTIVYVDITGASVAPNRIEITGLSEINTIPSMVEYINGVASTVGGVTFVNATFNPDVSAFDSGGSVTVTADVAGLSGNAITTTQTGDLDLWDDATLTGGVDATTNLQPTDSSNGSMKSSIWRFIGRLLQLNTSSEQTDLYWEESGATIIPKSI